MTKPKKEKEDNENQGRITALLPAIILLVCILCTGNVQAGTETLISTNTTGSYQFFPAVSGNWIVWTDTRNDDGSGSSDIYAYEILSGEERRITPPGSYAMYPAISGDIVVWEDLRNLADFDIYAYYLSSGTEVRVTTDPGNQEYPAIDGNRVVWQDDRNGDYDIYLMDLTGGDEELLTPDTTGTDQVLPSISGDHVVWEDYRNGATADIYLNDTTTASLLNLNPATPGIDHVLPAVSGSYVVWQDSRDGFGEDIFLIDTATLTERRVNDVVPGSAKLWPSIDGNRVVWIDTRNPGLNDVFLKDLTMGSDIRITTDLALLSSVDGGPEISGNRIVWTDLRNGDNDIFMYTIGDDETCPLGDFSISPSQTGPLPFTVQFTDTSTPGTTAISHWNWEFGDGNVSSEQNPSFTYTVPGNFDVRLTINNPRCRNATPVSNNYLISVGAAPAASFTTDTTSGMIPLPVTFTDTSVAATAWNWSFGDGGFSDEQNPAHTYTAKGTYVAVLNASNTFGYSHAQVSIDALSGADETADTMIDGIAISSPYGSQFLTYDTSQLPGPVNTGTVLISTSPQISGHGWQNITFFSDDGIGFVTDGVFIRGNISGVLFQTQEIYPAGFSASTGPLSSMNYSYLLPSYPVSATVNTRIWEGCIPADYRAINTIIHGAGFSQIWGNAYTTRITRTGFPAGGTAILHMSVNSSWVDNYNGRDHIYVERIADDRSAGEVLPARFLYNDTADNLDYFEIDSPKGLSTFVLSSLSGSGNPLQLITLSVTSHVSPPEPYNPATESDSGMPTGGAAPAKPEVPVPAATEAPPQVPAYSGTSAKVYTNGQGIVTQASRLLSTDALAVMTIPEGTVAKDAAGNPLETITLRSLPAGDIPPVPSGAVFRYDGLAYEIGPDGATFSPPVPLSIIPQTPQWGRDYTVKLFDARTGSWQSLPTTLDGAAGTVTAQVPHLCVFALFTEPLPETQAQTTPPPPKAAPQQANAQPPASAISIFANMISWGAGVMMDNIVIIVVAAGLVIAALVINNKRPPQWG